MSWTLAMIACVTAVLVRRCRWLSLRRAAAIGRYGNIQAEIGMTVPIEVGRGACLILLFILAGCGGHEPAGTLSVSCGGSTALAGARSIDVLGDPVNGQVTLSFPDPVNPDHRGAISVPSHNQCTITTVNSGG